MLQGGLSIACSESKLPETMAKTKETVMLFTELKFMDN
jgi:hypothetical protein